MSICSFVYNYIFNCCQPNDNKVDTAPTVAVIPTTIINIASTPTPTSTINITNPKELKLRINQFILLKDGIHLYMNSKYFMSTSQTLAKIKSFDSSNQTVIIKLATNTYHELSANEFTIKQSDIEKIIDRDPKIIWQEILLFMSFKNSRKAIRMMKLFENAMDSSQYLSKIGEIFVIYMDQYQYWDNASKYLAGTW